jgi:hypothetical protein
MTITAIQTRYAGCRFRSRLEARWAVFFDHLGVPWQYEPQGFELEHGPYLPDFFLPSIDTWYEVKGRQLTEVESMLATDLMIGTDQDVVVAWGDIPRSVDYAGANDAWRREQRGMYLAVDWDLYGWCICNDCGKPGIQYAARSCRICKHTSCDKCSNGDHPRILAAYEAARSARFEHGETPNQRTTP